MSQNPEPFAFTQNQREEVRLLGDKAGTLSSQPGTHQQTYIAEPVVAFTKTSFGQYADGVGTLKACGGDVGGGSETLLVPMAFMMREDAVNDTFHAKEVETALCLQALRPAVTSHHAQNLIVQPTAYILDSFTSNSMLSDNPNSGCREADITKCLDTSCLNPTAHQGGVMVVQKLYENHPNDSRVTGPHDVAPTIVSRYGTGGGNVPLVNNEHQPIPIQDGRELEKNQNGIGIAKPGDPAYTLDTTGAQAVAQPLAVDTFNQTLSPVNQTLRAGTDVDRMGGVLQAVISPTITTCKGSKAGSSSEAIDELIAMHDAQQAISFQPGNLRRQAGAAPSTETFPTLKCDSGDQMPHVCQPVVGAFKWGNSAHAHTIGYSEQNSPTLTAGGGGNMIPAVMHPEQSQGVDLFNQTLTGDVHVPLRTAQGHGAPAAIAPTLTASNDPSRSPQSSEVTQQVNAVHGVTMAVRRLTPRECERLQGFPDDWSKIPWKGKPADECPDGPRYKACGNSMAVPVMRWIGRAIDAKHQELYGTPPG